MKINKVQQNLNNSFKRVIKVDYIQNPDFYRGKYTVQKSINDLSNVLNNEPTSVYTKKEKTQLKNFFNDVLGDCNRNSPIKFRYLPSVGYVLLSGSDAIEVQQAEDVFNYLNPIQKRKIKNQRDLMEKDLNLKLYSRLENGYKNSPRTVIELSSTSEDKENLNRIDTINYYQTQNFYTSIFDGSVHEQYGEKLHNSKINNTQNIKARCAFFSLG